MGQDRDRPIREALEVSRTRGGDDEERGDRPQVADRVGKAGHAGRVGRRPAGLDAAAVEVEDHDGAGDGLSCRLRVGHLGGERSGGVLDAGQRRVARRRRDPGDGQRIGDGRDRRRADDRNRQGVSAGGQARREGGGGGQAVGVGCGLPLRCERAPRRGRREPDDDVGDRVTVDIDYLDDGGAGHRPRVDRARSSTG